MAYRNMILRKSENIAWRAIADEAVLVPVARARSETDAAYVLNETAARIWDLIDGTRSVAQIAQVIVDEYEVEEEDAASDLRQLVDKLVTFGAVEEVPG